MSHSADIHRDDLASKTGMWLFLFTEMLLFGALFVVYSVYRYSNSEAFHLASRELDVRIGTINTIILLISSACVAMSITAMQEKKKKLALGLLSATMICGLVFLVNKYFEWGHHIHDKIYPGSEVLVQRGYGDIMFYGLYYFMTGVHALHIIIGLIFLSFVFVYIIKDEITHDNFILHENGGLYWHLVDLIWIFLFPLFYLIA
ncbi:MAG TPA: cytochrome c oxidase subunit 3 family protein [Bacteroidales bacterium]|nr:cytochrome c oxidase subunit 3 family protein [Bacteroidales bacterium]